MQITGILAQMGGLQSMARELGVNENQEASGVALTGRLQMRINSPDVIRLGSHPSSLVCG
jgi:hypothetical protein